MQFKFVVLFLLLFFSQSALAINPPLDPELCPSISAIKAVGILRAYRDRFWLGLSENQQYDTLERWTFFITGDIDANNSADAIERYNRSLASIISVSGPFSTNGNWSCSYEIDKTQQPEIVQAVAFTPPEETLEISS